MFEFQIFKRILNLNQWVYLNLFPAQVLMKCNFTFCKNLFRQHRARYHKHNENPEELVGWFCYCHFQAPIPLWRVGWIKILIIFFIWSLKLIKLTCYYWKIRRWSLFDLQWWLSHVQVVLDLNQPIDTIDRPWIQQQFRLYNNHQWYKLHPMFESLNTMKSLWNSFYRWNPLIPSEKVQLRSTWVKILINSYGGVGDNVILVTLWLWQI